VLASPLERGESWEDCTLWALLRPVMGCESSRPESDALGSTLWWCLCHSSALRDAVADLHELCISVRFVRAWVQICLLGTCAYGDSASYDPCDSLTGPGMLVSATYLTGSASRMAAGASGADLALFLPTAAPRRAVLVLRFADACCGWCAASCTRSPSSEEATVDGARSPWGDGEECRSGPRTSISRRRASSDA